MADKNDLNAAPENSENSFNKDAALHTTKPAAESKSASVSESFDSDLAADPEFLALAAEFDASINNLKPEEDAAPPAYSKPDFVLVEQKAEDMPEVERPDAGANTQSAASWANEHKASATGQGQFEPNATGKETLSTTSTRADGLSASATRADGLSTSALGVETLNAAGQKTLNAAGQETLNAAGQETLNATGQEALNTVGQAENIQLGQKPSVKLGFMRWGSKKTKESASSSVAGSMTNLSNPQANTNAGKKTKEKKLEISEKRPSLPRLSTTLEAAPTVLSRIFDALSFGGLFILTAIFILQVAPGLQVERLLWFSDELRQADVLRGVFDGKWLQIYLNGELYQDAPPFYFWFLAALHKVLALLGFDLGVDYAKLLYIGAAVSGLLFLWATLGLAHSTVRLDRRGVFATGCVLLSVLFLQFFFHYSSLDLFFAAFIITSQIFLFKALMRDYAPLPMGIAFLCAAIALISKGFLGLAMPLFSAILFVLWRGKPQRLLKSDFLLGLFFSLVPCMIWLGSIWATGQHDAVMQMFNDQVWLKAFGTAWNSQQWWYLVVLAALWLPWSFLLLVVPWHRAFSRRAWEAFKSARQGERQGLAFVWISLIGAFALISLLSSKQPVYLVPLMGPLAVLTARGVLQLSPRRSMVLQRLMALMFFVLAVFFVLIPVYYSGNIPSFFSWLEYLKLPAWEVRINGIFLLAVVMLAATCLLIGVIKARRPESTLLAMLLCATLFSYPLSTMSMPSLDEVVSSKAASIEIKRYAGLGYYPVSFKVSSGVFSYYSSLIINETNDWNELDRIIGEHPKVIVAMSEKRWQGWTKHPGFTELMRFWMLSHEYVLLLRNTAHDGSNLYDDMQNLEAEPEPQTGQEFEQELEQKLETLLEHDAAQPEEEDTLELEPDAAQPEKEDTLELEPDAAQPEEENSLKLEPEIEPETVPQPEEGLETSLEPSVAP